MRYEDKIAALVSKHVTHRSPFSFTAPLAAALGCRTVETRLAQCDGDPPQPPAEYEQITSRALLTMLAAIHPNDAWTTNELSVLDGLCKNQRWAKCIESPQHAHIFAAALLRYTRLDETTPDTDLTRSMRHDITSVRREWLSVDPGRPSMEHVARAMFGDAWWHFAVEVTDIASNPEDVPALVQRTQPVFLPGLRAELADETRTEIPTLDGPGRPE